MVKAMRQTCTQRTRVQLLLAPTWSLVVAGRASSQNCSHAPVKVLPILVGMPEPLNKAVSDVNLNVIFLQQNLENSSHYSYSRHKK